MSNRVRVPLGWITRRAAGSVLLMAACAPGWAMAEASPDAGATSQARRGADALQLAQATDAAKQANAPAGSSAATTVAAPTAASTQAADVPVAPPPAGKLLPLTFPSLKVTSRSVVTYRCDGAREIGVAYMNTDNRQSFAVIRLDGRHIVLINVISGSGARYAADKYVWWSKGNTGNLYDLTQGENAAPIAKDCQAVTR